VYQIWRECVDYGGQWNEFTCYIRSKSLRSRWSTSGLLGRTVLQGVSCSLSLCLMILMGTLFWRNRVLSVSIKFCLIYCLERCTYNVSVFLQSCTVSLEAVPSSSGEVRLLRADASGAISIKVENTDIDINTVKTEQPEVSDVSVSNSRHISPVWIYARCFNFSICQSVHIRNWLL
jgi:hypothetical protein